MKGLTGNIRSFAYPMVGIVLVSSLWVMAAEKAKTDQTDTEYLAPLQGVPTSSALQSQLLKIARP